MAAFRRVPEMTMVGGEWTLLPFVPTQPAFSWNKVSGKTGTIYVMAGGDACKIGMTTNLRQRFSDLSFASPVPLRVVASNVVPLAGLAYAESWLHQKFADWRIKGEWFRIDPEVATSALDEAVVRAAAYAKCCEEWYVARYGVPGARKRKPRQAPRAGLSGAEFDELLATPGLIEALDSLAA